MKKNILSAIVLIFTVFACNDDPVNQDHSAPEFVSANVDIDVTNNIVATFNEDLTLSTADGFIIEVEGVEQTITGVEGSGTRQIVFILNSYVNYGNTVTIEYNGNGNAMNDSRVKLMSFGKKSVSNIIEETDLTVFIPNIPPDAIDGTIWLVIKTSENSNTWKWDYGDAKVNLRLSQMPETNLFDIVIFATNEIEWRPNQVFSEGYYCTLLSQENKYQNLKVVSWLKADTIAGVNMGDMNNEPAGVVNTDIDNAYNLRTDGMDYFEGDIMNSSYELWYKFTTTVDMEYIITIRDSNSDEDFFTGKVQATACDSYGWAISDYENAPAIANYPLTLTGEGVTTYIKVEVWNQVEKSGTFNIYIEEQ